MPIKSRPATRKDILDFFGRMPGQSVRARVLEIDGVIVGAAGHYLAGGVAVVFSDIKGDIPKMTIWREAKALMGNMKIPAICIAEDGAGPFLERLGWVHAGTSVDGEVYEWRNF